MVFFDGEFVPLRMLGTLAAVVFEVINTSLGFSKTNGNVFPFKMIFEAVEVATSLFGEVDEGLATITPGIVVV